jgi:hypothetical protein
MIHGMTKWGSRVWVAMIAIGCGGSPKSAASAPTATATPQSAATTDSAAAPPVAAASTSAPPAAGQPAPSAPPSESAATAATPPPPEHPFAKNAVEATSLIDDAINSRVDGLGKCVDAARARRKSAHEKLVVEVGIDEEGHMLGVQLPKHEKKDPEFVNCVLDALRGAPFPKSHAGVITVRKTFEDKAVYR